MSFFRFIKALCSTSLLLFVICNASQAQVTTITTPAPAPTAVVVQERPVIVTAVPAPKEVIVTPSGFANCFTVDAGWYQDIWIAKHRVCQYAGSPEGVAWIEGYWTCTKYDLTEAKCTTWDWKPARWEKTLTVY